MTAVSLAALDLITPLAGPVGRYLHEQSNRADRFEYSQPAETNW